MRIIVLALALLWSLFAAAAQDIAPARQAELRHLLKHDCGSCHGLTLRGGLGSALTAEALADRPAAALRQSILDGLPGTPMAPWRELLSEAEVDWLVQQLKRGSGVAP